MIRRGLQRCLAAFAACAIGLPACATPCSPSADRAPFGVGEVALLSATTLERSAHTTTEALGGLSGLDLDPATGLWHLLSDDRGERAPARYYRARIDVSARGIGDVQVLAPIPLPLYQGEVADPEALRRHPCENLWVWASEGDKARGQQPSVRLISGDGQPLGALALPSNLRFAEQSRTGARDNRTIEGLAFAPDGGSLWVAMEAPLEQDGSLPTVDAGAMVRLTRLSLTGGPAQQFAYPVDPVPKAGVAGARRSDNGISEILALGNGDLLVVERGGHEVEPHRFAFTVRLFVARVEGASDVSGLETLASGGFEPMKKRLLLDLASLPIAHIDNIEGAAWGPRLEDGRATLLLVSDDNFAPNQVTQLIALAIAEAR